MTIVLNIYMGLDTSESSTNKSAFECALIKTHKTT